MLFADAECNSELAIFGDSSVPPPLSLSAPELGSGEPWEISLLRNAVSSTELLHERAMARFYQAVAAEEAEKTSQRKEMTDRKLAEPSTRSTETGELSRKLQAKSLESTDKEEHKWHERNQNEFQGREDSFEAVPHVKRASPRSEISKESTLKQEEPVKHSIEEKHEKVFERIITRAVTEAVEGKPLSILQHREEEAIRKTGPLIETHREEKGMRKRDDKAKLLEENEEEVEEELEEESYYKNEELEDEESLEEESSEFDEEEELYKSMEEEETYHLDSTVTRDIGRFAEEEDNTYHPRSMVPAASSMAVPLDRALDRRSTPQSSGDTTSTIKPILKHNNEFVGDMEDVTEIRHELPSRNLERSPPKSFRESVPNQLMPPIISNKRSHSPSTRPDSQSPEPPKPERQINLDSVGEFRMQDGNVFVPTRTSPCIDEQAAYKIKTNISSAKDMKPVAPHNIPITASALSAAEAAKQKRMLLHKASVEDDTEASRVVADYYGDIIRDHARPKKPVRQYLNTAEMKAAAYVSRKQENDARIPEPAATQTLESEADTRLRVEAQIDVADQSAYDRNIVPVERPQTPQRKSRTPDLDRSRQSSKDCSHVAEQSAHDRNTVPVERPQTPQRKFRTPDLVRSRQSSKDRSHVAEQKAYDRNTAPAERPQTPQRKSRTPDLVRSRQSSKDRSHVAEQKAYDRNTAPAERPQTPQRKSRTPDLVRSRQSSKDRSRVPSTDRFTERRSKQLSELERHFSPERTQTEDLQKPCPLASERDEQLQVTEKKWRSVFSYLADLAMFCVASWLYAFKDERLAIPVLILMIYRQLRDAVKRRLAKLPRLPWKRSS
jgi:hypothetical protein